MSDKTVTETVDDFFDVRSLLSVLIGFVFTAWLSVLVMIIFGDKLLVLAAVWPAILIIFIIVLANAGKQTNGDLKKEEFEKRMKQLREELREDGE